MAVEFRTASLILAADAAIKAKAKAIADYDAAVAKHRQEYAERWQATHTEEVRALRDYLTKSLKDGKVPTRAQAKKIAPGLVSRYDEGIALYADPSDSNVPKPSGYYADVAAYDGLIKLLKAHTGDTISANQLAALGFKDLQQLFRDAAALQDKVQRNGGKSTIR